MLIQFHISAPFAMFIFTSSLNFGTSLHDVYRLRRPLLKSDTAIKRYTEPEPEPGAGATRNLFKLINYLINYCFQSPQETLVIVFSGGRDILKNTYYKVKMRRLN